jgi:ATP-dependent helicase/nuclease subunit B
MTTRTRPAIGRIHVTLALKGDGPLPEPAVDALGRVTTGPAGLLRLLEARLGIPAAEPPLTTRLIQYLACIDRASLPTAFYRASWEADPFSVARTLLQWRDHWYLAGWRGTFATGAPAKLADMAAIEAVARDAVDPGPGQRLQRVIALLPDNPVAVAAIRLRDRLDDFPPLWRSLIGALGAPVTEEEEAAAQGEPGTDLRRLQEHLLAASSEKIRLRSDGSLRVLRADTPGEGAPLIARHIRDRLAQSPRNSLAVLAEQRGDLLDEALEAIGAPRLGFTALSCWRPIFQVLPLACELLWEPLNPTALFQFLSHPVGPLPARQRELLASTVAGVPGIGSAQWQEAVARCLEREEEKARKRHLGNIHYWLESPRFPPGSGVPAAILAERAKRVGEWITGAREASDSPALHALYTIALNQTGEFVKAIERLQAHGRDPLTRDNVLRLIEHVRGSGAPVTDRQAQVSPGEARALPATHAGAFHHPVDSVIWWDCQASDAVHRWPWSRAERTALAASGVILQSEEAQLAWLGRAWLRPLLAARAQCTLVLNGDAERHHPVWDLLGSLSEGLTILAAGEGEALETRRKPLRARALPPLARWWQLPAGLEIPRRESESYSSLDAFIHSPYQWLLRYAARIRPGSLATVSDGSQLKGNLAHRLFEIYFGTHPGIRDASAARVPDWVDEHLPALLRQEGALLLEPGRQAECERFTTQLQESLVALLEHLQQAGVVSTAMELQQEGHFAGGKLNGAIDLLATTADGREAVVDIKWGGRKYRRDSLLAGSYLQLATYARLRLAAGVKSYPGLSYFIVSDARMLSLDHGYFPNADRIVPETQESPARYWQRLEETWRWRRAQFDLGLIEVTVTGAEPTGNSDPGEAALPMPEASDGFNDYAVLTGWGENE